VPATGTTEVTAYTVDALAREAGLTVRNVRAYQERGILPPPRRVGRTGYYGPAHLDRLRAVSSLLERGYSLAAIADLLRTVEAGGDVADLLGLEAALRRPWSDESPAHLPAEAVEEAFGADAAAIDRAVALGLLEPEGDGYRVPSPRLLASGAELVAVGVPLAAVLDVAEALRLDAEAIARRFVAVVADHVVAPLLAPPRADDALRHTTEVLERLRPVAVDAVQAAFAQAMEREIAAVARAAAQLNPPSSPEGDS
jgi:DNA-binding transcriptional MerR regulator